MGKSRDAVKKIIFNVIKARAAMIEIVIISALAFVESNHNTEWYCTILFSSNLIKMQS